MSLRETASVSSRFPNLFRKAPVLSEVETPVLSEVETPVLSEVEASRSDTTPTVLEARKDALHNNLKSTSRKHTKHIKSSLNSNVTPQNIDKMVFFFFVLLLFFLLFCVLSCIVLIPYTNKPRFQKTQIQ